jgi:hypothetical protein
MYARVAPLLAACTCLFAFPAFAHRPVTVNDRPSGPANAYALGDIAVSQVAYHVASPAAPQLWLRFSGDAGDNLYFGLGVPVIAGLESLRPEAVLLGPGLPPLEGLPFAVPDGFGGLRFRTAEVQSPEIFYEPFTGTSSWQFPEWEYVLPATGEYYLVTYLPHQDSGKFWTVVGREESFGIQDLFTLPPILLEVRAFHELPPLGGTLLWGFAVLFGLLIYLIRMVLFS